MFQIVGAMTILCRGRILPLLLHPNPYPSLQEQCSREVSAVDDAMSDRLSVSLALFVPS
jgi:hypothetical protein